MNSTKYEIDMCSGSIMTKLIKFSLPLVFSGILQLLYNTADLVVVGKFGAKGALAAVGSTGSISNLIVNLFIGLSVGAGAVVARCYGAEDKEGIHRAVHTSIAISLLSGIILAVFGVVTAQSLLLATGSPADVIDQATLYMRIIFLGMPVSMLYNFASAILRAVGDSKRPLYYISISGVINIVLNLVFVIGFHLDVAGVAIATVISQVVAAILILKALIKSDGAIKLHLNKLKIYKKELIQISKVGLPAGVQGSLFSISNVIIQSSINSFGSAIMGGNAAAANIESFVYTSMNAIYHSTLNFASQNFGAGKYKRLKRVLIDSLILVTIIGITTGAITTIFARPLISIFTKVPEEIEAGIIRMMFICIPYFLCGIMEVLTGQLRGIGYSIPPMIVSIIGVCGFRIGWIFTVFARERTLETLFISYPISWFVTAAIHFICYLILSKKLFLKEPSLN